MGKIDKLFGKIGLMSPEEDEQEELIEDKIQEKKKIPEEKEVMGNHTENKKVVDFQSAQSARENIVNASKMKVIVIEPRNFDDAQQVANNLREKKPVVINFEKTEAADAKRIIDFISGTTYALNGEIKKVGHNVFLCAPSNVNVSYTEEERKVSNEMPWLKK